MLPKREVKVFRTGGGYIDGEWREGGRELVFVTDAVVQPAQPRDLRNLPEGADAQDAVVIHSPVPMHTVEESQGRPADEVEVEGMGLYRIMSVGDWSGQGFRRYVGGSLS